MPAYNAAHTLKSSLLSILCQTWRCLEVVVINDGSTDETGKVLARIARKDSRVRVIERSNGGIVAALNQGWSECSGTYVARMDADDISLPWRLATQVAYMERHRDVAASGTGILPFQTGAPFLGLPARFPTDEAGIRTRLLFNPPIMHPTAIFRRSMLPAEAPYSTLMPQAEDYELWSRLASTHRYGNIGTIGLLYRRTASSISSMRRDEQLQQASALRIQNLARTIGDDFAIHHGAEHVELMARRHSPLELVDRLPNLVDELSASALLSWAVLRQVWFSYCLSLSRAGGHGSSLFGRVERARSALRQSFLRAAEASKRTDPRLR